MAGRRLGALEGGLAPSNASLGGTIPARQQSARDQRRLQDVGGGLGLQQHNECSGQGHDVVFGRGPGLRGAAKGQSA